MKRIVINGYSGYFNGFYNIPVSFVKHLDKAGNKKIYSYRGCFTG